MRPPRAQSRGLRMGSSRRAGRLIPRREAGLRAAVVVLPGGGVMDWHSTRDREELLIILHGLVRLETRQPSGRLRSRPLPAGRCVWFPAHVMHRLVNPARQPARYIYVTGPTR